MCERWHHVNVKCCGACAPFQDTIFTFLRISFRSQETTPMNRVKNKMCVQLCIHYRMRFLFSEICSLVCRMTLGNCIRHCIRHCESVQVEVKRILKYISERNKNNFNYEAVLQSGQNTNDRSIPTKRQTRNICRQLKIP